MISAKLNAATVDIFTKGCCWQLALELSNREGWPIYCFGDGTNEAFHGYKFWMGHVVVSPRKGLYLDAYGLWGKEELRDEWEGRLVRYTIYQFKPQPHMLNFGVWGESAPTSTVRKTSEKLINFYSLHKTRKVRNGHIDND